MFLASQNKFYEQTYYTIAIPATVDCFRGVGFPENEIIHMIFTLI